MKKGGGSYHHLLLLPHWKSAFCQNTKDCLYFGKWSIFLCWMGFQIHIQIDNPLLYPRKKGIIIKKYLKACKILHKYSPISTTHNSQCRWYFLPLDTVQLWRPPLGWPYTVWISATSRPNITQLKHQKGVKMVDRKAVVPNQSSGLSILKASGGRFIHPSA